MSAQTSAGTVTHTVLQTRLGELTVVKEDDSLTGLYFPGHWPPPRRAAFGTWADDGFEEVARQLEACLTGERDDFDLPLKTRGTEFDRFVWDLIRQVPFGQTTTYGELARRLGTGTSPRAVGSAVGRNPLCIIIPCHRVIGSTGKLTGYAGGLERKRALLDIERERCRATGRALVGGLF
jgi:methylated-DNA-[protein]-cysteine S-methyltransferase